jgi:hypothetical protein
MDNASGASTRRLAASAGLAFALLAGSHPAQAATGRDLTMGYEWFDSASGATPGPGIFDFPVTTLNPADNSAPIPITLPWNFPFYGGSSNTVWVSDNGWMSFTDPGGVAYPAAGQLPSPNDPDFVIAPFWSDLNESNAAGGRNIRHGRVSAASAYRIQYSAIQQPSGQAVLFDTYLYADGRIKIHYLSTATPTNTTVGIENGLGSDGFSVVDRGAAAPGVPAAFAASYVIDILPPPTLAGECALVPDVACGTRNDSLPGPMPFNIVGYGCSNELNQAREQIYAITLTAPSRLQATVVPGSARNLRMFLLPRCSERQCLRGPTTNMDLLLSPGTYYVVVDALAQADEGTFTLNMTCSPIGTPLNCGDTVSGDTTGGSTLFPTYACAGVRNLSGAERMYGVSLAAPTNLRATLSGLSADLDVLIFALPATGEITDASCVLWGDNSAVLWGAAAGNYVIVVDGVSGAAGPYTLETECSVNMDCSLLAGSVDFSSGTVQAISGDTTTGVSNVDAYRCDPGGVFDGNELLYEINLPTPGQVAVFEPGTTSGLSFFVLRDCNEGSCVGGASGACGVELPAGIHYLVVDSASGAEAPFFAQVVYEPFFNRWTECQDPGVGTSATDTVRTVWNFDDNAYCYTDPTSRNYPNGCTFAMYAVARCGTEFHIPLFDCESGHVRVFDVFGGNYVELDAVSTGGWRMSGNDISWTDCPGTDNTLGNEQTIDISFSRPTGLCGVYRLEFPLHSGFIWDLYANCTGTNTAGFPIYDSLCGALDAFDPLPNVNLTEASVALNCPDITVTYTLQNNGCAPATNVVVTLFDNGAFVDDDVVAQLDPGGTVVQTFSTSFPGGVSTSNVTLEVDAGNAVQECEEEPGAGCNPTPGQNIIVLADCSNGCDVTPQGTATPSTACEGDPVSIDATGSSSVNCPGGVLEYQLSGPGVLMPWQSSPIFSGLVTAQTTDYVLEVRCADPTLSSSCVGSMPVRATVERRPALDPASVAFDERDCELGIALTWTTATFFGPTLTGAYNIYRSTISCADAVSLAPAGGGWIGVAVSPNFTDVTTQPNVTYYYVVEAEDETRYPGGCVPPGPQFGGAVTRVNVPGGACAGIYERFGTNPVLLPKVGGRLRLGWPDGYGPSSVTMRWGTDRPIDASADEHYHVMRSDVPMSGFAQINVPDPPLLQVAQFTDAAAAQAGPGTQLFCYLLFVANACHDDNHDEDPSRSP